MADLLESLGGLPFVSDKFRPPMLLALTCEVRRRADPEAFPNLADYLVPENANRIFARHARHAITEHDWIPLSAREAELVGSSIVAMTGRIANWQDLFGIPIRLRGITVPGIRSQTSTLLPQTIYLGRSAFAVGWRLEESLVHEHAHVWLNLLGEIQDLQLEGAPRDLVLPSGTSGKSLRGVILAAHFAASAIRMYDLMKFDDGVSEARREDLVDYLGGCLGVATGNPFLSPLGIAVTEFLSAFSASLER
ncbi:hypothetical protein ACIGXM_34345 [Kitasatospora sp. NPDC052896]|uniref:hypothetical protein n=1 Tax=Kitasatospora sp. NPDC052896 TaxID=3364061 RepID=UPI0037CB6D37